MPFSSPRSGNTATPSAGELIASLLGDAEGIDSGAIAAACSEAVVWEDIASRTYQGRAAVAEMLNAKFPRCSRLAVERVAGNATTGGFTWRREAVGDATVYGLRGTTYVRLDEDNNIAYVREGSEPLFKAGPITEAVLKAATANVDRDTTPPTYTARTPTTAQDLVEYLWREAYPNGAKPDVALDLFAADVVYEDFNYDAPFVGKPQVKEFVEAFDIPGLTSSRSRFREAMPPVASRGASK
ncbi:hypothetical protein CTAYLR_010734 [Chrysophaeum taylorii]|uniref:SnoaL-like domain-containing protein n=1 Tax=Chrysophaeum taylorii TaxID=2483200 RepID=A0AAD7XEW8_9STRA|nr:hypothetical protein CTAYLR_010734 [Chrysophaeum taylorii]